MNLTGIAIGLCTFLIIGLFHPLVIKGEYYMGQNCNWLFLAGGTASLAGALFVSNTFASSLLGVTAFSCFWSILEVREQRERVRKGWYPANPRRMDQDSSTPASGSDSSTGTSSATESTEAERSSSERK